MRVQRSLGNAVVDVSGRRGLRETVSGMGAHCGREAKMVVRSY